jgi:hypothetical protein
MSIRTRRFMPASVMAVIAGSQALRVVSAHGASADKTVCKTVKRHGKKVKQ